MGLGCANYGTKNNCLEKNKLSGNKIKKKRKEKENIY
jgi:hypothetical protein